ncbi:MAG TPA: hypothetical protein VJV96_03280 [Candidatus Angelobacter sp.]|nr:hypothetical protein [Candidatus Angelobacter sp.]
MSPNQMLVAMLIFCAGARIRGCFRRWRQPLLRGPQWFFNVSVQQYFYTGPGRKLLRHYRLRMLLPVALEAALAVEIFISGRLFYLAWLILGISAAIHLNHLFNVDRAEQQARKFAEPEAERPACAMVLSLKPRRLRDYSNPAVEGFIVVVSLAAFSWLLRLYLHSTGALSLRVAAGVPVLLLYQQLGFLFVKYGIVAWRTPIPHAQAEEHMRAREEARKLHLKVCDWCRILITLEIALFATVLAIAPALRMKVISGYWVMLLIGSMALAIWHEKGRLAVVKANLRARPMKMPEFSRVESSGRLLCYQPATPMLLIKGAHGYALNLANRLTQFGAAYLAGLIALFALLQIAH